MREHSLIDDKTCRSTKFSLDNKKIVAPVGRSSLHRDFNLYVNNTVLRRPAGGRTQLCLRSSVNRDAESYASYRVVLRLQRAVPIH